MRCALPQVLGAVLVFVVTGLGAPAHADVGDGHAAAGAESYPVPELSLENLARSGLNRTRRAIAIGPFIGAAPLITSDEVRPAITFGLGLSVFRVPILPDPGAIRDIVKDRAQHRLKKIIEAAILRGEQPTPEQIEIGAHEVYRQVLRDFLGEREPKLIERPAVHVHLEATRTLFSSADWQTRISATFGVGPLSVGPTLGVDFTAGTRFVAGLEAHVQVLPSDSPRSPIVDLFLRADLGPFEDTRQITTYAGARLFLDLI